VTGKSNPPAQSPGPGEKLLSYSAGDRAETLGEVLLALGGRLTRLQTEILAGLPQPLTIRQYRILSRVDNGHTSLTALSKLARRNLSTMSESVDKLVTQGLLSRTASETSRRTMRLALTAAGRAALEAGNRALGKFTAELTTHMPQDVQDQLLPALKEVYTDVQGDLDDR
jgi:DNA-binding MarR family transcriptional regulator